MINHDNYRSVPGPSLEPDIADSSPVYVSSDCGNEPLLGGAKGMGLPKFANLFRYVGGAALVLAGVIYMLQGLDDVSQFLRQWVWLGLITAMGVSGYLCRMLMDDIKSARIFFILATALISVQFSQLGGMLFDILQSTGAAADGQGLHSFWSFESYSSSWFLVNLGASAGLAAFVSFVGFAILLRKSTILLSAVFIAFNLLMLFPGRGVFSTALLVSVMGAILFAVRWKIFKGQSIFRSIPGRMVRGLLIFPLVIVLVRNSFHIDTIEGISVSAGVLAVLMVYGASSWFSGKSMLREICIFLGGILALAAWYLYVPSFYHLASMNMLYLLPAILLLFECSRMSHTISNIYRNIACALVVMFCAFGSVFDMTLLEAGASIMLGVAIAYGGFLKGLKIPLFAGVIVTLTSLVSLMASSLSNVTPNIWLFFAVGGVLLVLFSSVVEKYGTQVTGFWRYVNSFE